MSNTVLSGTIKKILYKTGTWILFLLDCKNNKEEKCSGVTSVSLTDGAYVTMYGGFKVHPKYGKQFAFTSIEVKEMSAVESYKIAEEKCVNFLSSVATGVGPVIAKRIVKELGANCISIISVSPERLEKIKGISKTKAQEIHRKVMLASDSWQFLLEQFVLTPTLAKRIYTKYGRGAIQILRENPYRLIGELEGIGFKRADEIALSNGIPAQSPVRAEAAIIYVLSNSTEIGNCYETEASLKFLFYKLLSTKDFTENEYQETLDRLVKSDRIVCEEGCYYSKKMYKAEQSVAENIVQLMRHKPCQTDKKHIEDAIRKAEEEKNFVFEEQQTKAVYDSLSNKVSIITGGPGTGKTTILQVIVDAWLSQSGRDEESVILCAPTGKAAKRMSETTGLNAQTIHSLLAIDGLMSDSTNGNRVHVAAYDKSLLIIDESSMIDIEIASKITHFALRHDCNLIFVGDADQLAPIGAGKFFKDIVEFEKIPKVRLTLCHRQSGTIRTNAYKVKDGCKWSELDFSNTDSMSFVPIADGDYDHTLEWIKNKYTELLNSGYEAKDIGVIVPLRQEKQNCVTVDILNKELRQIHLKLSPTDKYIMINSTRFYVGDRVMNTKNNKTLDVYNGDSGTISDVNEIGGYAVLQLDDGREIEVNRDELSNYVLAYAITVHKSQGSEYSQVITVHTMKDYIMLERNLTYTAITRAKERVFLVGEAKAFAYSISHNPASKRKTKLLIRLSKIFEDPNYIIEKHIAKVTKNLDVHTKSKRTPEQCSKKPKNKKSRKKKSKRQREDADWHKPGIRYLAEKC